MIYQKIFDLIEKNKGEISQKLVAKIRRIPGTEKYSALPEEDLYKQIDKVLFHVYSKLADWLHKDKSKDVVFGVYTSLGKEKYHAGLPLPEVILVLMLIKREVWEYIRDHRMFDSGYELNQLMEVNFYIDLFFDRIIHSTILGYEMERAGEKFDQ